MTNPQYKRLVDSEGHFVGFQRTVIEFNQAGAEHWQLDPIEFDPNRSLNLTSPPVGIGALKRPKLGK